MQESSPLVQRIKNQLKKKSEPAQTISPVHADTFAEKNSQWSGIIPRVTYTISQDCTGNYKTCYECARVRAMQKNTSLTFDEWENENEPASYYDE